MFLRRLKQGEVRRFLLVSLVRRFRPGAEHRPTGLTFRARSPEVCGLPGAVPRAAVGLLRRFAQLLPHCIPGPERVHTLETVDAHPTETPLDPAFPFPIG